MIPSRGGQAPLAENFFNNYFNNMSLFSYVLQELIQENYFIASIFLYLSIIFLGNISAFIALWIVIINKIGILGVLGILVLTYLGDVSGDLLWFNLGKLLKGTRIGFFVLKHLAHQNNKFENAFLKNGLRWFVVSKFFYGSSPPIAFSLGWSNYDIKKVIKISAIATAFWVPILFGLSFGIIFGILPLKNINFLNKLEWIFIIGIIAFIFAEILISKLIKKFLLPKFQFLNKYFNNGIENNNEIKIGDKID
jgi:membrane protein DedA with SNARE-associated domain